MSYGHGGDIYTYQGALDFSVNVNPLGPPPRVAEAAKRGTEQMAAYPDSRCGLLREKLAHRQGIPQEYYLFGNGAADLIYLLVLAEKPRRALIPVPAFSEYEQALKTVGCEIKYYQTKQENGFCIDVDFLEEIRENLDMVFLCSPANPSGRMADRKLLEETARRCERLGVRLVLDECFIEFTEDGEASSMMGRLTEFQNLFLLRAFTKIYAMPGLRLGYGICADTELLRRMESSGQPWRVSAPAQEAGRAALEEDTYVETARRVTAGERRYLEEELKKRDIFYIPSEANFILLYSERELFQKMLSRGILIRDCGNYRGLSKGWYRIAVRTHEENQRLIAALDEALGRELG